MNIPGAGQRSPVAALSAQELKALVEKIRIELRFNHSQGDKRRPRKKRTLIPPAERRKSQSAPPRHRGAPRGNQNALKHGRFTRKKKAFRALIRLAVHQSRLAVREANLHIKLLTAELDRIEAAACHRPNMAAIARLTQSAAALRESPPRPL